MTTYEAFGHFQGISRTGECLLAPDWPHKIAMRAARPATYHSTVAISRFLSRIFSDSSRFVCPLSSFSGTTWAHGWARTWAKFSRGSIRRLRGLRPDDGIEPLPERATRHPDAGWCPHAWSSHRWLNANLGCTQHECAAGSALRQSNSPVNTRVEKQAQFSHPFIKR
jgi:hypothetical protein